MWWLAARICVYLAIQCLLRYICVCSTSKEPTCGLYYNYADLSYSLEEIIALSDVINSLNKACLLKASVTMTSNFAITIINGSQIVPSTQFHSQGLGQRVVWFLCISKGASCWDWLYLNKHICTGEEFFI